MQGYFKSAILFIITGLLFTINANSQIKENKKGSKKPNIINTPQAPKIIDTENNNNPNIDLSGARRIDANKEINLSSSKKEILLENTDSVLNFFIKQSQGKRQFTFITGNVHTTYELNTIFTKHAELVKEFILRFKNQKDSSEIKYNTPELKSIYDKIQAQNKVSRKIRNKQNINNLFSQISRLNTSKEKVALYLNCAEVNIDNKTYYNDISIFCEVAKKYAVTISNLYDQAKAYALIGDFASDFKIPYDAIQMYYLAREAISNSNISDTKKNHEQGDLCYKLGSVFYSQSSEQATEKAGEYYVKAEEYYNSAGDYRAADLVDMFTLDIATTLWDNYYHYNSDKNSLEQHNKCLNALKEWFTKDYNRSTSTDNDICYMGLYSVATNLFSIDEKAALLYYIEALPYALFGLNLDRVLFALDNVSLAYAVTGNNKLSLKYSNLEILIADSLKYNFTYDKSVLRKAENYFLLKRYDSALAFCNDFISDTAKKNYYYPTYYDNLLEDAYRIKYISLDSLNRNDSARAYERLYTSYQSQHYYDLVNLIYIDSKSASEWSERSRDKAFAIEKELGNTLKKNLILKQQLLDSANKYALRDRVLAEKSDSIRIRDSISSVKSLAQEKKNTDDQKKIVIEQIKLTEKQKTFKNWVLVGSVAAAIILLSIILIGRSFFKLRIREKESALRIKESEIKRIDELARNKIHNIENDYSEIGVLLNSNEIEKLKQYNEEYESFLAAFLSNWKSELITLEDELVATLRYCKVKAVLKPNFKYNIESRITEPAKLIFLQSVFDTLLDNSVRHNSQQFERDLLFNIGISKEANFIRCVISDNGTPPANDPEYLRKENSGLNLLKSRIKNFYLELNKEVPKNFFTVNAIKGNQGTEVKIILPYEEI